MTDHEKDRPSYDAEPRPTLADELADAPLGENLAAREEAAREDSAHEPVARVDETGQTPSDGEPTQQFSAVPPEGAINTEQTGRPDDAGRTQEAYDQYADEPTQQFDPGTQFDSGQEPTQLMAPVADPEADRRAALDRRREELAARDRALGNINREESVDQTGEVAPYAFSKRSTDKFLGAFGLFVLRLVMAAILAVHGYQNVTDINASISFFEQIGLPYPTYLAWAVGIAELVGALALVFGFLVRVVGIGVMVVSIGALVFVRWGSQSPFRAGMSGFVGEFELLLAAVGLLLFCLGGGGWGIDGGIRRGRARRKAGL